MTDKQMKVNHSRDSLLPHVSVVIPMRNEEATIERCLSAVLAQDYPSGLLEVLVADGQSTDGSRRILEKIRRSNSQVRVIDNPEKIVPTGLNRAIRAATGEVIVRVDGHTEIAPDYVRQAVSCLQRTGAQVVGGPMRCAGGGLVGDAIALATSSRFGIGNSYFHYGSEEREVDSVYMGVFRRSLFDTVGWFDEELVCNQDDEFNYRVRRAGGAVVVNPEIRSRYRNRTSMVALARQYWRYGFYKARVFQKHPQVMSWRHAVPPLFALAPPGSVALWPVGGVATACLPLVAGSYTAAAILVSASAARKKGLKLGIIIPAVFATMHLAWGTGLLVGLWRFRRRWRDREWTTNLSGAVSAKGTRLARE